MLEIFLDVTSIPFFDLFSSARLEYKSNAMHATPSKLEKRVGQTIRSRRREKGFTLSELSRRARMDVSQLSKIERGQGTTRVKNYERLAKAIGLGLGELFSIAA
jgi:ribosome-binding protein aMBF1 (putative translation factor)